MCGGAGGAGPGDCDIKTWIGDGDIKTWIGDG